MNNFGETLKELREQCDFTRAYLEERSGVDKNKIEEIETGEDTVTISLADKLLNPLGRTLRIDETINYKDYTFQIEPDVRQFIVEAVDETFGEDVLVLLSGYRTDPARDGSGEKYVIVLDVRDSGLDGDTLYERKGKLSVYLRHRFDYEEYAILIYRGNSTITRTKHAYESGRSLRDYDPQAIEPRDPVDADQGGGNDE